MDSVERKKLDRMCKPAGIAIFGGVGKPGAFARAILASQIMYGYQGKIYPISPGGGEVLGQKIYKSLDEVEGPVDLASVSVPRQAVPDVLKACLEFGVAGAQVHSSGFAESGDEEGILLQKEIERIAKQGLRIVGPNCFGIHCTAGGITILPGFDASKTPGPVALITQSGGVAVEFVHEAISAGIHISKVISFGNGCDVDAVALFEYLAEDPDTQIIAAYLEGIGDGRRFLEIIKKTTPKKPVVIWKGGLTPLGGRAVKSHTASMGGAAKIWEGILDQSGVIAVQGMLEMMDTLTALTYHNRRGKKIALIGGGGAIGVYSSDLAYQYGLEIPRFQKETQKILMDLFPTPGNSAVNPLDTGTPSLPLPILSAQIKVILERESIDAVVLILLLHPLEVVGRAIFKIEGLPLPEEGLYFQALLKALVLLKKNTDKDIILVMENSTYNPEDVRVEKIVRTMKRKYQEAGIPVYSKAQRALTGIRNAGRGFV